mgnify:CR=1 FL=1
MSIDNITPKEWNKARKDVSYDPVLKPEHYNKGDVESWDIIKQQVDDWPSYLEASVLKYYGTSGRIVIYKTCVNVRSI